MKKYYINIINRDKYKGFETHSFSEYIDILEELKDDSQINVLCKNGCGAFITFLSKCASTEEVGILNFYLWFPYGMNDSCGAMIMNKVLL